MNVPSGYTALDLIGFTDKGAYNSATSYVKNDLVSYNGEKWRCKLDDTVNHTPEEGTYWTIFIDAPSALDDLADVTISSVANGNILEYDSATSKWKNSTGLSDVKQALTDLTDLVKGATEITTKSFSPVIAVNDALPVNAVDVSAKIEPIQAGSGTPSPSNVRAISGRTEITVTRAGKNLIEGKLANLNIGSDGTLTSTTEFNVFFAKVKQGNIYSITTQEANTNRVYAFYESKPTTTSVSYNGSRTIASGVNSFTAPIDGYVAFRAVAGFTAPQLELGSTVTAYEAPNVNDYTIQLGDTYYGGTLDVTTGLLSVTSKYVDLSTLTWELQSYPISGTTYYFWITQDLVDEIKRPSTNSENPIWLLTDRYQTVRATAIVGTENYITVGVYGNVNCSTNPLSTSDTDKPTGQLVYELTTPITVQLTPQEIQMLQGNNTIFTDSGDTSIQYYANGVKNLETVVAKMQTEADGAVNNQFKNGAVNLLENKATSTTKNGITMIVNADSTLTFTSDGTTRTGNTDFDIAPLANGFPATNGVTYHLSGCPSGGSDNNTFAVLVGGYGKFDIGNGVDFTASSTTGIPIRIYVRIYKGYTFSSSLTFKPMITLANVPNSDYAHYVPYCKSNKELTEDEYFDFTTETSVYANTSAQPMTYTIANDGTYRVSLTSKDVDAQNGATLLINGVTIGTVRADIMENNVSRILKLKKGAVITNTNSGTARYRMDVIKLS